MNKKYLSVLEESDNHIDLNKEYYFKVDYNRNGNLNLCEVGTNIVVLKLQNNEVEE